MSYCRWSSDDYQCDVYVYEHVEGGFDTHIAGYRYKFSEPLPPPINIRDDPEAWYARHQAVLAMTRGADMVPIDLPLAGAKFCHDTAEECAEWLEELRKIGFIVPQYAIDALREEGK